ncbi:MAG: DNA repair protein RecN, partial [Actinobacteria bacterium]|nr:DNA repair protein RecN [Actinomycetota bacterium]
ESIEVEFHDGLNVLTGETGTGKTVLVGAIGLLLGDRADTVQVRHGARAAVLECAFDLTGTPEAQGELERLGFISGGEEELMLGRTVPASGKSRCNVNGHICPVSTLGAIGDILLDVHGQNTHQALTRAGTHVEYLDRFAGREQMKNLGKYRRSYDRLKSLLAERRQTGPGGEGLEREAELLRDEVERIRGVKPLPDELEKLEAEAGRLRHARELWELSARVEAALVSDDRPAGCARDTLSGALEELRRMSSLDRELSGLAERVESIIFDTEDVAAEAAAYRGRLEMEPSRLEEVESRLSMLRELCRRHGGTLPSVLSYLDEAESKLRGIEESIERAGALDGEIEKSRAKVAGLAEILTRGREEAASALEEAVAGELGQLELKGARFEVEVRPGEEKPSTGDVDGTGAFGPRGSSEVEFLFSPVPEGPARPLRRIASGGEMSRVMLALKIVLAGADRIPTLVFDEVDAGIGGQTAAKVGEKLHQLTRYHQVFCVTHIPRIATFADWHYQVFKSKGGGGVRTGIELLSGDERVDEICRMLGDTTGRKVTREHARDILDRAQNR